MQTAADTKPSKAREWLDAYYKRGLMRREIYERYLAALAKTEA